VEVHNSHFLAATMSLPRRLKLWDQHAVVNVPLPSLRAQGHDLLLAPPPCLTLPTPNTTPLAPAPVIVEGRPVKRLSQAEMEEQCRLGLFYNCNKKFKKKFRCYIGCFIGCRKVFLDTNKKTNYIARLETARRIY
jgi:hypothetical protein